MHGCYDEASSSWAHMPVCAILLPEVNMFPCTDKHLSAVTCCTLPHVHARATYTCTHSHNSHKCLLIHTHIHTIMDIHISCPTPCTERSHILCLWPPDTCIQAAQGPALCDLLWTQQEIRPGTWIWCMDSMMRLTLHEANFSWALSVLNFL